MADATMFLRKRSNKQRPRPAASNVARPSTPIATTSSALPIQALQPQNTTSVPSGKNSILEFKLFSPYPDKTPTRYNILRLNTSHKITPASLTPPILFNRRDPGPKAPPTYQFDESGKPIGRYLYQPDGKPVLDENGQPAIERKIEMDMSMVGSAPGEGGKQKVKKGVREVYHQDKDVIRLRREEAEPWVMESASSSGSGEGTGSGNVPDYWVGRMVEPSNMPTVLLVNDGLEPAGFTVRSLGRSYKFDPERPFKVLDPEAAHKLFEHQSKHKIHDRWAQREGGATENAVAQGGAAVKGGRQIVKQEQRAVKLEQRMRLANSGPSAPASTVKTEKFEDDYKREGRLLQRGLEGGADEELDYDVNDDFQDDEDNNTFYRNEEEEEEAKLQEERMKKEFRMANANVGDKPQIEDSDEDESDDLFGDDDAKRGNRKLKKMMRRGMERDDLYGSDSDDDSDTPSLEADAKDKEKEKEKEKNRANSRECSAPPSTDRPGRPSSRGPGHRGTSSPTGANRSSTPLTPTGKGGKSMTAPPIGSGSALLAQRAASETRPTQKNRHKSTGSASASGSKSKSPVGSPPPRPTSSSSTSTPTASSSNPNSNKRKTSPSGSSSTAPDSRKRKKSSGSSTPQPEDIQPFEGMITRQEVRDWLVEQGKPVLLMKVVIGAFTQKIRAPKEAKNVELNQKMFLKFVGELTRTENVKYLRLKDGI